VTTCSTNGASHHGSLVGLTRVHRDGIALYTDDELFARSGIRVAFTERTGGVSHAPFDSLNLASHVGDDPVAVNANRERLLAALDLSGLRDRLVTAEQIHGVAIHAVGEADAGRGALAQSGLPPIPATDGLVTSISGVPLLMFYADCVPIILVAEEPRRAVSVLHAGWRGAYGRIAEAGVAELVRISGSRPQNVKAYVGAHIAACCYEVDDTLVSQFCNRFDTITAVDGRLDLGAVVTESLLISGVRSESIVSLAVCTFDQTEQFFSYRARHLTGRHGALAVITEGE